MFWLEASLLDHHALEVPTGSGLSVHGHARLSWGVGQLLRPLQCLHQVWVGSVGGVTSRVGVRASISNASTVRHHVRGGNATLLHPGVNGAGVVHEAGPHV